MTTVIATALIASFRVIEVASLAVSRVSTFLISIDIILPLPHLVLQLLSESFSSLNLGLTAIHHQLLPRILTLLKDLPVTVFHLHPRLSTLAISKAVPFLTSLQYHHVKSPVALKDIAFQIITTSPTLHHRHAPLQALLSWGIHQPCLGRKQQAYLRDSIIFTMIQVQCKPSNIILLLTAILPESRCIFFQHLMGLCRSNSLVIQRYDPKVSLRRVHFQSF